MSVSGMGRRSDPQFGKSQHLVTNMDLRSAAEQGLFEEESGGWRHQAADQSNGDRPSFAKLGDKLGDQLKMLRRG